MTTGLDIVRRIVAAKQQAPCQSIIENIGKIVNLIFIIR